MTLPSLFPLFSFSTTATATATSIMSNAPKTYKAAFIEKAGAPFDIQDVRLVVLFPPPPPASPPSQGLGRKG